MDATAYADLCDRLRRIAALEAVGGLLNWDQETVMPPRGGAQRAEHSAAVAAAAHRLLVDPALGDLIASIDPAALDPAGRVNVAEARRRHLRASRIPAPLAADLARAASEGQRAWLAAREAGSFAAFGEPLSRIVALKRAEAECLAEPGTEPYDALLIEFEPGTSAAAIAELFDALRPALRDLRARIAEAAGRRGQRRLSGRFPAAAQLAFARRLGDAFGYDWQAGRLDLAVHPSSSGTRGDVRITTRIDEGDPLYSLYSTIHELGHALYEQALPAGLLYLPAGEAASMGMHESQSRLLENQIGRGAAFCDWLFASMTALYGDIGVGSAADLHRAVNTVETGFIRTEADEVHYNLHVMLRFDLERALIGGSLEVMDLEDAWNARFREDFGLAVPDARRGVLQDIHWAAGLFGYFPSYTLGNVYAAELFVALGRALPDLETELARGDPSAAIRWLNAEVHAHARLLPAAELVEAACGRPPDPATMTGYLDAKYGELYDL